MSQRIFIDIDIAVYQFFETRGGKVNPFVETENSLF